MSTATAIGLGIVAWVLSAIVLALVVGRMIRQRGRSGPGRKATAIPLKPQTDAKPETGGRGSPSPRWDLNKGT